MPIQTTTKFINEKNKEKYQAMVLSWLESDYVAQGKPKNHFFYNREIIASAFNQCRALVVLDNTQPNILVGYMVWSKVEDATEIDIVEVNSKYRRQGIFKKMLSDFAEHFSNVLVLTASVLKQAENAFNNVGWTKASLNSQSSHGELTPYYKIIQPSLEALHTLPDGCVIAVCSENYYQVKENPEKYQSAMKFFRIRLNENGKLYLPIITAFYMNNFHQYEGYIGVYLNKKLITEGKIKNVFKNYVCRANLLMLSDILPVRPELFEEFLMQLKQETVNLDEASFIETSSSVTPSSSSVIEEKPVKKRKQLTEASVEDELSSEELNIKEPKLPKYKETLSTSTFFTLPEESSVTTEDATSSTMVSSDQSAQGQKVMPAPKH